MPKLIVLLFIIAATGLRPIYVMLFEFWLISFQMKNKMIICGFDSNKVSKSLKISTFYLDESTHLRDFEYN